MDFDDAFGRVEDGFGCGAVDDEVGLSEANLSSGFQDVEGLGQQSREERRCGAGEEVDFDGGGRERRC